MSFMKQGSTLSRISQSEVPQDFYWLRVNAQLDIRIDKIRIA